MSPVISFSVITPIFLLCALCLSAPLREIILLHRYPLGEQSDHDQSTLEQFVHRHLPFSIIIFAWIPGDRHQMKMA